MNRIPNYSNNSGRITILVIGVTALSMLVSVVSLYLFMSAGRTMLPGPLAFRIAVSLPQPALPAPAIPLPLAIQAQSASQQAAPLGETVADTAAQLADVGASIQNLQLAAVPTAVAGLADEPVVDAPVAAAPQPAGIAPEPVDDDDNSGQGNAWGVGSGSGSGSDDSGDDDDNSGPGNSDKPAKPEKDKDKDKD